MARGHRIERIQSSLLTDLAGLIRSEADEKLATSCTLTRVQVSGDLSQAEVYFLVHGDQQPEQAARGLQRLAHRLQALLYQRMRIRRIPHLHFVWDQAMEKGLDLSLKLSRQHQSAVADHSDTDTREKQNES